MAMRGRTLYALGLVLVGMPLLAFAVAEGITLDSSSADRSSSVADGSFAGGWKWQFHFTVLSRESDLKIRFSDFSDGTHTIPASSARIYIPQADAHSTADTAVALRGANVWSDTFMLSGDENSEAANRQITVVVEVAVPAGSSNGSYAATYDLQSAVPPDTTPPVITRTGDGVVSILVGGTYTDGGATATDDRDGDISAAIVVGGLPIDTSVAGSHTVTYDVSDAAGNAATRVTRTVNVVEVAPPPPDLVV